VPKKKTLAESNPYLRDPEERKRLLFISAATSSAVEGIRAPFKVMARELGIDWPLKKKPKMRPPKPDM